jgi:hypothetical protein
MAMVCKLMTHNNGIDPYPEVIQIFNTRLYYVPLLTETFVEIGLRSSKPRIDDDIKPFIQSIRRR